MLDLDRSKSVPYAPMDPELSISVTLNQARFRDSLMPDPLLGINN